MRELIFFSVTSVSKSFQDQESDTGPSKLGEFMTMRARFTRKIGAGLLLAAVVGLSGCSRTIRIRDLLDRPQEYDGKTVEVQGTVTQSAGVLGAGAYEIDDGTGKIYVVARGGGVPREGAKTKAKGRFESVFNLLGRTLAAIVQ